VEGGAFWDQEGKESHQKNKSSTSVWKPLPLRRLHTYIYFSFEKVEAMTHDDNDYGRGAHFEI
jgi:hypothetical protein